MYGSLNIFCSINCYLACIMFNLPLPRFTYVLGHQVIMFNLRWYTRIFKYYNHAPSFMKSTPHQKKTTKKQTKTKQNQKKTTTWTFNHTYVLGHQVKQGLAPGVFHFVPDANQHTTQTPGYSVIVHLYIHVGKSQPQSVWPPATCDTTGSTVHIPSYVVPGLWGLVVVQWLWLSDRALIVGFTPSTVRLIASNTCPNTFPA